MIHDFDLKPGMIDEDQLCSISNALNALQCELEGKLFVDVVDYYEDLQAGGPYRATRMISGELSMALGACHILQKLVDDAHEALKKGKPLPWEFDAGVMEPDPE